MSSLVLLEWACLVYPPLALSRWHYFRSNNYLTLRVITLIRKERITLIYLSRASDKSSRCNANRFSIERIVENAMAIGGFAGFRVNHANHANHATYMFIARSSIPNESRATRLVQSVGLYHPPSSCFLTFCLLSFALLEHVACLCRLHRKCSLSVSAFYLASPCPSKAEAEAFRNKIVGTLGTLDQIACSTRQLDYYI